MRKTQPRAPRCRGPSWLSPGSALHSAFDRPGGFVGGALGFLCFGWATAPVAVAAARGMAYFFGGMAATGRRARGGLAGERGRMAGGRRASGRDAREKRQQTAGKGPRVASRAGPRAFFACAGSSSAPEGAEFGLGPPAPVLARAGEKRASGSATGAFFWRRRGKIARGGPVGGAAGDALSQSNVGSQVILIVRGKEGTWMP